MADSTSYGPWEKQELAALLRVQLEEAKVAREPRLRRWMRNRNLYYCEPVAQGASDQWQYQGQFNVMQVKGDQVQASVVDAVVSQTPVCTAMPAHPGVDVGLRQEAASWFFMAAGGKRKLREVAGPAFWANKGVIKTEYVTSQEGNGFPKLTFRNVSPQNFLVYPGFATSLEDACLVGEMVERTRGEIEALQADGTYIKGVEVQPGDLDDPIAKTGPSAPPVHEATDQAYQKVVLFTGYCRKPGAKEWHAVTFEPNSQGVLRFNKDPEEVLAYSTFSLKAPADNDGFWPSTSPANDLQQCQLDATRLFGVALDAAAMAADPKALGSFDRSNAQKGGPGALINTNGEFPAQFAPTRSDMSGAAELLQMIVAQASEISRATPGGMGIHQTGVNTAQQAEILAQGQQESDDDYLLHFAPGVESLFEVIDVLLRENLSDWWPLFGGQIQGEEDQVGPDELKQVYDEPVLWRLSVQSAGGTPRAQLQGVDALIAAGLQAPQLGYDIYELGTRRLKLAETLGFPDAEAVQMPRDPAEVVQWAGNILGLDPRLLAAAIDDAKALQSQLASEQQAMGGMAGAPVQPMAPGAPGGMPGGAGQDPVGMPTGGPGAATGAGQAGPGSV